MAQRWEDLAEFRHQQLLLEEAQMLQLQAFRGRKGGERSDSSQAPDLPQTQWFFINCFPFFVA